MKTLTLIAALAMVLSAPSIALSDQPAPAKGTPESPKPIVGKAPVDAPSPETGTKEATRPGDVFDVTDFDAPDKATEALLKNVDEKCTSDPRSREGMNEAEARRCNASVARLVKAGPKAIGAIFKKLDESDADGSYYARTRLYNALGKTNDPKVEEVLIRGYARIASRQLDAYSNEMFMIESALITMNGTDPVGAQAIGKADVTDQWQSAQESVMTWRLWQRDHAGKSKTALRSEELKRARTDKSSKDLKTAYLAMSTLAELAPSEGLKAVNELINREDISDENKSPFYAIEGRAYENGAIDAPEPEVLPVKSRMKKR